MRSVQRARQVLTRGWRQFTIRSNRAAALLAFRTWTAIVFAATAATATFATIATATAATTTTALTAVLAAFAARLLVLAARRGLPTFAAELSGLLIAGTAILATISAALALAATTASAAVAAAFGSV